MPSPHPSPRNILVTAGIGVAALVAAAAAALPAAANPHDDADPGNSANAPGHSQTHGNSNGSTNNNGSTSESSAGQDPAGNNGTVFIHDVRDDEHPHNVPHVSCNFWVDFFGFDNSQSVTVSFAGQAPTGKDQALGGTTTTTLQADAASGAGNDWDGELAFTADQLGVSNLGDPAHEGYHVKMTVVTNQPGDHKYKVFWIQPCATATSTQPATVSGETTSSSGSTETSAGTTETAAGTTETSAGATEESATGSNETSTQSSTSAANGTQVGATLAGQSTSGAITPLRATRSSAGIPTDVLGTKFTRSGSTPAAGATASSLPFTGAEIGGMALAAALALGGGVLLTAAGRRRRRVS